MSRLFDLIEPVLRLALPPRCPACGAVILADDRLCLDCWAQIRFLPMEGCRCCGVPMDRPGEMCGSCLVSPPLHDGVRAAVIYDDLTRELAVRLKYGRRIGLARTMARLMDRLIADRSALLVPVPLHRWRLWSRGFNQALLIARELARQSGNPVLPDGLLRVKATPRLKGLGARDRARVVKGAFVANPDRLSDLRGANVLLIDDVHTSGATAGACAKALKRAGVARVEVVAFARVPIDAETGH